MHSALASQHEQPQNTVISQSSAQNNAQLTCITAQATFQKILQLESRHAEPTLQRRSAKPMNSRSLLYCQENEAHRGKGALACDRRRSSLPHEEERAHALYAEELTCTSSATSRCRHRHAAPLLSDIVFSRSKAQRTASVTSRCHRTVSQAPLPPQTCKHSFLRAPWMWTCKHSFPIQGITARATFTDSHQPGQCTAHLHHGMSNLQAKHLARAMQSSTATRRKRPQDTQTFIMQSYAKLTCITARTARATSQKLRIVCDDVHVHVLVRYLCQKSECRLHLGTLCTCPDCRIVGDGIYFHIPRNHR